MKPLENDMTTKITTPTKYKLCIIAPAASGFDVFDDFGRWFHAPTQRQARWWASVYASAQSKFASNPQRPVPPTNT